MRTRLSVDDRIILFERLGFLLDAGLPLRESLELAAARFPPQKRRIVADVAVTAAGGTAFSDALDSVPGACDPGSAASIRWGEQYGALAENVRKVAAGLKRGQAMRQAIVGSLAYPAIILGGVAALTWFMTGFIFPKIRLALSSLRGELPASTRTLIAICDHLARWWLGYAAAIAAVIAVHIMAMRRTKRYRTTIHAAVLSAPIIGALARHYILARTYDSLATSLEVGAPIDRAIGELGHATANEPYARALAEISTAVGRGMALSAAMAGRQRLFFDDDIGLVAAAERAGCLPEALGRLASAHASDADASAKRLTRMLEPALMTVAGLIVGFVALSIISPMYGMANLLGT